MKFGRGQRFFHSLGIRICGKTFRSFPNHLRFRETNASCNDSPANKGKNLEMEIAYVHDIDYVHGAVNKLVFMNANQLSEAALEKALAAKMEELLRSVDWLNGWRVEHVGGVSDFDLLATLPLPDGGIAALCVECKGELRPSNFARLADRVFSPAGRPKIVVPVLALPGVSLRVAELCAEHGWSWFDLAGNCRLDIPGVLRLEHSGNKPVHGRPRPVANLSSPEAGRVIRALLLPEHASMRWTQREIQKECQPNVSLGLVNKVARHLRDEAFIVNTDDGGFRLCEPLKLLFAWRDAYRFDRHERRGYFTLLQGKKLRDALARVESEAGGHAAYASFSGCGIPGASCAAAQNVGICPRAGGVEVRGTRRSQTCGVGRKIS